MRSRPAGDGDLTTRARIRDAAVTLIGSEGFARTTIRQVAQAAGVSPGLVIHHFGSKQGLRDACDDAVTNVFSDAIAKLDREGPNGAIRQMAQAEVYLPVLNYVNRTLRDGGPTAKVIFDRLVTQTERWLSGAVAAGTVRPSDDEHARATLLVAIDLGMQLLMPYVVPDADPGNQQESLLSTITGPAIELYTHGIFTTTAYLDAFRDRVPAANPTVPTAPRPTTGRAHRIAGAGRATGTDRAGRVTDAYLPATRIPRAATGKDPQR